MQFLFVYNLLMLFYWMVSVYRTSPKISAQSVMLLSSTTYLQPHKYLVVHLNVKMWIAWYCIMRLCTKADMAVSAQASLGQVFNNGLSPHNISIVLMSLEVTVFATSNLSMNGQTLEVFFTHQKFVKNENQSRHLKKARPLGYMII